MTANLVRVFFGVGGGGHSSVIHNYSQRLITFVNRTCDDYYRMLPQSNFVWSDKYLDYADLAI